MARYLQSKGWLEKHSNRKWNFECI